MTRRDARIKAMQILYTSDFNKISIDDAIRFYDETPVEPMTLEFVVGVQNNMAKIDEAIERSLVNYTLDRLNLVDKAILRLAGFELIDKKIDKRIIINEALEITKAYSDQGDHRAVGFNNKVLDRLSKIIVE